MIHIVIAEDHLMVRAGLRALLEKTGEMVIDGEASNGQEALELTEALKPDVLVMDIMMPRLNGVRAVASDEGAHAHSVAFDVFGREPGVSGSAQRGQGLCVEIFSQ
jgi:DNA-binding NarL/FixJ family response regulator